MEEEKFKWYSIITDDKDITQGDIFLNIPIFECENYDKYLEESVKDTFNAEEFQIDIDIKYVDCIVLTQPCDLARPKPELKNVILCKIYDIDKLDFKKNKLTEITSGKRPQYYMLNECNEFKYQDKELTLDKFNYHIVNFDEVEKVPIGALKKYIENTPSRLRLLPPYREHLSQAFAKYFMRIGLPSDIDASAFDEYK